ncbi:hypothetical protein G9C98_002766 [Cotesia typhae]|uniref:Threonine aspartase n=1 Tax=Cotesia typhae TaxID=2053667 RepID=A0A8J5QVP4_9HYME|nr:hypothetical protein G9C98_002766 [Cotesia typhae]
MTSNGFIAVHVGAGHHSDSLKKKYQKLCRDACKTGIENLKLGGRSLDAVVEATTILEDSSLTNAGFGSNLTLNGDVECDASVMDGNKLSFGAVGAVSGIKNPVSLAKRLCEHQSSKISYGRVPPSVLVGPGAQVSASKISKRRMDTVGAVCVDAYGNVAAACSSGGIILKYPGRVGQAGIWGCGVWAHNGACSVASSTSGCGEHLIRTTLARTIAEAVTGSTDHVPRLHETMKSRFLESEFLDGLDSKLGGGLALRYCAGEAIGDLFWTHSTNSMILGYMGSGDSVAKSYVSNLDDELVGKKVVVEGICFRL